MKRSNDFPEADSKRNTRHLVWPIALCAILCAITLFRISPSVAEEKSSEAKSPPPKGLPVETVVVATETLREELTLFGSLSANEATSITSEIAGKIASIDFVEGKAVAQGRALVRLDDAILSAEKDRAQAAFELSETELRRADTLLSDRAISQRERDEAYAQWRLGGAALRLAEAQLAKTVISAPFAGTLGIRKVSVGDYLRPGDVIATLDDVDPLKVDFRVPEIHAARLAKGQHVEVTVDALPGRSFPGTVYAVDPQVDSKGRSILLRARVPNRDGALMPGMFARIKLTIAERPDAVVIPEAALIPQAKGQIVFKVVDGIVAPAPVTLGLRKKGMVEILGGLNPGEMIITGGHLKVGPGMPVTAIPAPAASSEGVDATGKGA